jgi:hypothetical protein
LVWGGREGRLVAHRLNDAPVGGGATVRAWLGSYGAAQDGTPLRIKGVLALLLHTLLLQDGRYVVPAVDPPADRLVLRKFGNVGRRQNDRLSHLKIGDGRHRLLQ